MSFDLTSGLRFKFSLKNVPALNRLKESFTTHHILVWFKRLIFAFMSRECLFTPIQTRKCLNIGRM